MSIYKSNSLFHRLDLSLLRHFFAIATFGGFSKASRATGISQPALSLGLKKLEKTLGVTLVDRKAREFALTQAGLTLLTFCHRLEGNLEAVVSDLEGKLGSIRRRLRIGTALSIGFGPLVEVCSSNSQSKDPYEIELSAQNTYQLLNEIVEGTLDAALVPSDVYDTRLKFSKLYQDDVTFVYGSPLKSYFGHKTWTSDAAKLTLVNYPRETPMRSLVDKICMEDELHFRSILSVNGVDAIKKFVVRGIGGAFVLRSLVQEELRRKELFEAKPPKKLPSIGVAIATLQNEHGDDITQILKGLHRKTIS
jgi:DNA-binding transcriptional LysR family regulator